MVTSEAGGSGRRWLSAVGDLSGLTVQGYSVDSLLADKPAAGVSANKIVDSLLADQPAAGVAANKIVDSLLADQPATGVTANKIVDSLLSD